MEGSKGPGRDEEVSDEGEHVPSARLGYAGPDPLSSGEPVADGEATPLADDPAPHTPLGGVEVEVVDDQGDLIDLEDEPELVEPPEISKHEKLKIEATSAKHLRDQLPKNPY